MKKLTDQEWQQLLDANRAYLPSAEESLDPDGVAYNVLFEILDHQPGFDLPEDLVGHVIQQIEPAGQPLEWIEQLLEPVLWVVGVVFGCFTFGQLTAELVPGFSILAGLSDFHAAIWLPALGFFMCLVVIDWLILDSPTTNQ